MENCLVTKLKTSVEDVSLPMLGKIRLAVDIPSNYMYQSESFIRVDTDDSSKPIKATIIGDGYFKKSKDDTSDVDVYSTNNGKSIELYFTHELILSKGSYIIEFESKYDIKYLALNFNKTKKCVRVLSNAEYTHFNSAERMSFDYTPSLSVELGSLIYNASGLQRLQLIETSVFGDISSLNKLTMLERLYSSDYMSGTVDSLNECCAKLSTFLPGAKISGNIDNLVVRCMERNPDLTNFTAATNGAVFVGGSSEKRDFGVLYTITSDSINLTNADGSVNIATYNRVSKKWSYED